MQPYVYDHARCTKTGFHYGNFLYVGMLPDTAKDPRGVSHIDQEVTYPSLFNSPNLIQLGATPRQLLLLILVMYVVSASRRFSGEVGVM